MKQTSPPQQRKYKRAKIIKDVTLEGARVARSCDIGAGGMYIETVASFSEGDIVLLKFKLGDSDEQTIKGQALVKYVREGVGIGLAFTLISTDDQQKIEYLVNHREGVNGEQVAVKRKN